MSWVGKHIGNYEITEVLGEGGMGTVYLGRHPLIGKQVAIKVLLDRLMSRPEIVTRFFHEARAVNEIGHDNIVDVVDLGKVTAEDGFETAYLIMEYLDGESLGARLRRVGVGFDETMHMLSQCCSALAASHQKGIIHRDLKPENIFLCARGGDPSFVKLLDFGIAKLIGGAGNSNKTATGMVLGTPSYMSPEQCEARGELDGRSDIYSLGIVMYELLTGQTPFAGQGFGDILIAHLTRNPGKPSERNPDVPPELDAIVMHALEKDPARRFATMTEFGEALADPERHFAEWEAAKSLLTDEDTAKPVVSIRTFDVTAAQAVQQLQTMASPQVKQPSQSIGTLAEAAGEVRAEMPRKAHRSRSSLFLGLGAVGVAATIAIAIFHKSAPDSETAAKSARAPIASAPITTAPVAAPVVAPIAVPATVNLTVESTPPGATVYRDDVRIGVTPITMTAKMGGAAISVRLERAGYSTRQETITPNSDKTVPLTLELVPPVAVAVAPQAVTPPHPVAHAITPAHPPRKRHSASQPAEGGDTRILQPSF